MEERIARLETHVEHIRTDIADMKIDIRRLNDKVDGVELKLSGKIDALVQAVADLKVGRVTDRVWWLLISAAQLGILAKAFKWI